MLLGLTDKPICYPAVPNLVFTFPRIAQVGVSLDAARKDHNYRVVDVPYGQAFLFNTHNEASAKMAFIFEKGSNLLAGTAAVGADAGAWIDVLSLVIFNKDRYGNHTSAGPPCYLLGRPPLCGDDHFNFGRLRSPFFIVA